VRHLHITLRPVIYRNAVDVIAYEVDGMPSGQHAAIHLTDDGAWQILWTIGGEPMPIRVTFKAADEACRALTEAIRTR